MNNSNVIKPDVKFCSKCTCSSASAVQMTFDDNDVCTGCLVNDEKTYEIDWNDRFEKLKNLLVEYKSKNNNYDCIIPVSGGKDSYFQTHIIKNELGFNPLLVTYNGNNYSKTGLENVQNMREVFGCDHIFFTPSVKTLIALNRLGMLIMGDMNWHNHCGIFTYPIKEAVQKKIPLMIWGEHGYADIGGMYSYDDFIEFTYRNRHEHGIRGFEWYDILKAAKDYKEKINKEDLLPWMYPSDEDIESVGVRGIYLSNYVAWNANEHTDLVVKKYGFKLSETKFERTYRTASNLDDIYENGIHDYMKWIKFGYGRSTDHTSKDIRSGDMTRKKGVDEISKRDHIKSKDLKIWLEYVGWTEDYFDKIADNFRDPRVWWIKDNQWVKKDISGKETSYGTVHLPQSQRYKFFIE